MSKKGFYYKYNKRETVSVDSISKQWIESQSNINDSVRFIIEKYAYEHGIFDLNKVIPKVRDKEYYKKLLNASDVQEKTDTKIQSIIDTDLQNNSQLSALSKNSVKSTFDQIDITASESSGTPNIIFRVPETARQNVENEKAKKNEIPLIVPDCYE